MARSLATHWHRGEQTSICHRYSSGQITCYALAQGWTDKQLREQTLPIQHKTFPDLFKNVHSDTKCTPKRVDVFERGMTLPGALTVSLVATTMSRPQLDTQGSSASCLVTAPEHYIVQISLTSFKYPYSGRAKNTHKSVDVSLSRNKLTPSSPNKHPPTIPLRCQAVTVSLRSSFSHWGTDLWPSRFRSFTRAVLWDK